MSKQVSPPPRPEDIEPIRLRDALEERYLAYALSTIMHRALPDVRDGLKPVHRRLLYAMRLLRLDPGAGFKKCARMVGDVIGKFHPHGDQSVYDAMVRLAQDFAQRYPLIEGQGNFGNIDGDNAAAYRYTEARLTEVAALLIDGIDEDAVDFRADLQWRGRASRWCCRARFPICSPMAHPALRWEWRRRCRRTTLPSCAMPRCISSNIPMPAREKLMQFVPGPDFPTGGTIVDSPASILEAYNTGRGTFRVRARWAEEQLGRGTWQIVVTEIPFQVQKARLDRADRRASRPSASCRCSTMSATNRAEDVRLVLEPKSRTVDPRILMEQLFRSTELEARIPLNMNVLSSGRVPSVLSLQQVLQEWLDHRNDVLVRRSRHRLAEIGRRLEVLGGYLIAYLNIDEVIRIIRESRRAEAGADAAFRPDRRPGRGHPQHAAARPAQARGNRDPQGVQGAHRGEGRPRGLLASEEAQWQTIADQVREVRDRFGKKTELGRRRTDFATAPTIAVEAEQAHDRQGTGHRRRARKRAGSAPCADISRISRASVQGGRPQQVRPSGHTTDRLLLLSHSRQVLHPRGGEAAGRPRPWRAAADDGRPRGRRRHCRPAAPPSGRPAAACRLRRQRLHRARGGMPGQYPQGQAGDERQGAGRGDAGHSGAGRRRPSGGDRRQPQAR